MNPAAGSRKRKFGESDVTLPPAKRPRPDGNRLENLRPLRETTAGLADGVVRKFRTELRDRRGNVAYFQVISPRPVATFDGEREAIVPVEEDVNVQVDPRLRRREYFRYLIICRSGLEGHSEARCRSLFDQAFPQGSWIEAVFTERSPCEERRGGTPCYRILVQVLGAQGLRGLATPVRFEHDYPTKAQLATSADLTGKEPEDLRDRNTRATRKAIQDKNPLPKKR